MPTPSRLSHPRLPFLAACLGIAIFSAMDAGMKQLTIEMGAYNAMLWRTMFSLVVLGPFFLITGGRWPAPDVFRLHVGRGLSLGISLLLFFWGLAQMPLAQGIALGFIAPLIALALAALFLKERVGRSAIGASVIAFAGVLVILAGHHGSGSAGVGGWAAPAAVLAAALLYAVGVVVGRPLAQRARPLEVAIFFNLVVGTLSLLVAPWLGTVPGVRQLPLLIAATLSSNVSIMLLAWAYARAETQRLLPVEYTAFLWAALYGWLFFGEGVSSTTLAGAALIVGGCLWAARGSDRPPHAEPDLDNCDARPLPPAPAPAPAKPRDS